MSRSAVSSTLSPSRALLAALALSASACVDNNSSGSGGVQPPVVDQGPAAALNGIDLFGDGDDDGIVDLPATVPALIGDVFDRYTAVSVPSGARVHLLTQSGVDDSRLRRAREVLRQHLSNVPGSAEGAQKSDVAEAMAARGATLLIFRDPAAANPANPAVAAFLAGFQQRSWAILSGNIVVEGTPEYQSSSPVIDGTFGATAALVHRTGFAGARPARFAAARTNMQAAIAAGLYTPPAALAVEDHDDAFVALALDVHSGVFGHDPLGNGTAASFGTYRFVRRADMAQGDPATFGWIDAFFAPAHTFAVEVAPGFTGNFECLLRTNLPYTNRSQYLRNVRLTGSNSAEIFGAREPSTLFGNSGNNNLKGRGGDDLLDGGAGFDTAVYDGPAAAYNIEVLPGGVVRVTDSDPLRDGSDLLTGFERLQFTDGAQNL